MTMPKPEPRIAAYEELAYGMFIHWGLYALVGQGEWSQCIREIPAGEYRKLKDRFTAEDFDGRAIARLAKSAGMKYITLTARHHDGFSLYDTGGLNDYDAPHSAAGRDLVADFVSGCRDEGIVPFLYHTTIDWYAETFEKDFDAYLDYLRQSVEVLCKNYGEIGGLYFDGNWAKPDADWKEDELYGMIRNYQPQAIIIDNTGLGARGVVGHPEIDATTFERGRPTPMDRAGMKKYVAAEMNQTMNTHWGRADDDFCYFSPREIIEDLCACRKVGANYLINVGPTAAGRIPDYEAAAFRRVGQWVKMHEKAIYHAKPCAIAGTGPDFALQGDDHVYLFIHNLTIEGHHNVTLGDRAEGPREFTGLESKVTSARWLDSNETLAFTQDCQSGIFSLESTGYPYGVNLVVRVAELTF